MAEMNERLSMPYKANEDLRNHRYLIMRNAGERLCAVATLAGAGAATAPIGILENTPNTGQSATIVYQGVTKVVAGGSLTQGLWFTCNGSGRATAAVSGDVVVGRALQAASADGDVISALVSVFRIGPIS